MRKNKRAEKPKAELCEPRSEMVATFDVNSVGMTVSLKAVRDLVEWTKDYPDNSRVSVLTGYSVSALYPDVIRRVTVTERL